MQSLPYCPRCHSIRVVKSGHHHGKQRWLCRRCRYQFTRTDPPAEAAEPAKRAAVTLYGHGLSIRCVARLLATSAHSVIRWVTAYVETCCFKPAPAGAIVIEEMWHYLDSKANKLWIWTAFDRATGRLIDWECGDRDQATFECLLARLRRWNVRLICTDEYVVYQQSLSAGRHYAGKDQTIALERIHARLRHWLARFRRRTVSRSREMVDCSIALAAHLHINRDVDPSFCYLPLAAA
jgi:insertion element IS1 protein InsB